MVLVHALFYASELVRQIAVLLFKFSDTLKQRLYLNLKQLNAFLST